MYQKKKKKKSFCLEESAANFDYHHLKASCFPHHFFGQFVVIKLLEISQILTTSNLNPKLQSTWMNRKKEMDDCCPLLYI
jgi:hypothetical protein